MRDEFVRQLGDLRQLVTEMGNLCTRAISEAVRALMEQDAGLAREIMKSDDAVNALEHQIEQLSIRLILTEQPVASDLRFISSTLKMVTDLERIGDHAVDIAELALSLIDQGATTVRLDNLRKMSEEALKMVNTAVRAFIEGHLANAEEVIKMDDVVDGYFETIRDEVMEEIREDRETAVAIVDHLMIAKYLERVGDHAQNIAEWVIYCVAGRMEHYS
uniref:phosphate signaling complex protein PhoU n=1 Tax=Ndongobacter massiliensis TaxID=1871025 RepID=UPI00092FF4D5|nr:phosphate signaling complex protein PhoU [Ndongobacter massiliensis]